MFGSIIPAPLAIATMLPRPTAALRTLGKESVVMMPRATGRMEPESRFLTRPGRHSSISPMGSLQPMIPVDAVKKSCPEAPRSPPRVERSLSASSLPPGAQTLEILLLIRTPLTAGRASLSLPMSTGAPGKRFFVNKAAKSRVSSDNSMRERFIGRGSPTLRSSGKNLRPTVEARKPSGSAERASRTLMYSDSE